VLQEKFSVNLKGGRYIQFSIPQPSSQSYVIWAGNNVRRVNCIC